MLLTATCGIACGLAHAAERTQNFDDDPNWEARNNRAQEPRPRDVRQDFGYCRSSHAGGRRGEVGGFITPAAEPAYYAARVSAVGSAKPLTFDTPLAASGTFACPDGSFHVLLGFFNSCTTSEWRTPNSIVLRLNGRGDKFHAYVEYCTRLWRAGGDSPKSFPTQRNPRTGRQEPTGFACGGQTHRWTLKYDPAAGRGNGAITATIDGLSATCELSAGHKGDGATFDRFGLVTVSKSVDSGGEVWIDDVTINGAEHDFSQDPGWEGLNNRRTYQTQIVRPRFDFGFSPTHFAGGARSGELGGVIFRGDCRYPDKLACYADRLDVLSSQKPLRAAGKVCLHRGVSDSGVLIGFFNARESLAANPAQDNGLPKSFLGVSTDAPSREGFYFAPTYRMAGDARVNLGGRIPPRLLPDGRPHDWTLAYVPDRGDQAGRITVTLDGKRFTLPIDKDSERPETHFDRFGIITPWIDGNSQTIYFDDLRYTWRQE
jgi:hypothetical protein